jgi:signal transduction histidine kinase
MLSVPLGGAHAARQAADRERASAQRSLIARDLHDVVGHNISLINLQAGVGLDLIDDQPEQAREALAAIRAVSKEALTNIARHAPGATASILLDYSGDSLDLEVRDSGPVPGPAPATPARHGEQPLDRRGNGIAGMRERAVALGGHLDAGHRVAGGFEVAAHLPAGGSS